jgi:PAS domain-containing protein
MDDFEDTYERAIEAGQRNLRATKLLSNWCFHAEFVRSPGRGMIEAATGLPIGHMGVQCKFSKKSSMHCWLLEDAVYDFYQNNCKGCMERVPVGFPNIMSFIDPRENAAEKRKRGREEEERVRKQKQTDRRQERAELRYELSLEETFVFDLLDELDQEDIARADPRLEQLANLAPEAFTRKVVEHLLPAVLHEDLPYSKHAAKALFRAPLKPEERFSVAVRLVSSYEKSPAAIDVVLADAEKLSQGDLTKVLHRFVSMALGPPPGIHLGGSEPVRLDAAPILSLFQKRCA